MPNISETIRTAAGVLRASGIREPRREAVSLLALALNKEKTFLIAHPEYELTDAEKTRFEDFLKRRAGREPFQHISGRQEFYGLEFAVSKHVLIPRPETEMLCEEAIRILGKIKRPRFCDVGTGSGCIAVAILHHIPSATGVGLDISEKALTIAAKNAKAHDVGGRLRLIASDVFGGLFNDDEAERFDLIVSNPPYIPRTDFDELQPEVRLFDPMIALTDGEDGLSFLKKIIEQSPRFLSPGGHLLLEIGIGQWEKVKAMFPPEIWCSIDVGSDLQGIPRMVRARKAGRPES